jgi:two-component system response regulator FixJ
MALSGVSASFDGKRMNEKPIIHVIDGDDAVRDSIGMLLRIEGFVVHLYPSGVAFLLEADLAEDSCLVIDMHPPGLSGAAIPGLLRSWGIPARVVAITHIANINPSCIAIARDPRLSGPVVLEKPFSGPDLLRSVKIATRQDRRAEPSKMNTSVEADRAWGMSGGHPIVLNRGRS